MRNNRFVSLSLSALLLVGASGAALAQAVDQNHEVHHSEQAAQASPAQEESPATGAATRSMMGAGMGMMNPEMMHKMHRMMRMQHAQGETMMPGMMGMMGRGMTHESRGHAGMMRLIFILMDTDSDGALSQEEAQSVTERVFNAIDADDDNRVTPEEIQAFHRALTVGAEAMPMRHSMQAPGATHMGAGPSVYADAMQTMMGGMADMEVTGDPEKDFALMMIPHHQSAIDMAEALLEHSNDPELTQLANEIITEQQREITFLEDWLRGQEE